MRRPSSFTVLSLVLGALLGAGLAGVQPAAADEVATAQARVDRLQKVAAASTDRLVAGTQEWEADRKRLRSVELGLRNSRRHVADAQAAMEQASRRLGVMASELYRSPYGRGFGLAFTNDPDEYFEAASALQSLDHAAGGQDQVLREATTARLRLRAEQRAVEQQAEEAKRLVTRSAQRLAKLKQLAAETAAQLDDAQADLVRAKNRAEARSRAARASRTRSFSSGGAFCTGKSTAGQSNGNLDPASLCPLWMASGHRLRSDAAAAFNKMSQYHADTVGSPLCVTDSYRSYSEQAALYRRKPGLAAVPGKSEHGWGKAVDFCGGVQDFDSAAHQWMKDNAGKFGWYHPDWARRGGSRPEAWHWEYGG